MWSLGTGFGFFYSIRATCHRPELGLPLVQTSCFSPRHFRHNVRTTSCQSNAGRLHQWVGLLLFRDITELPVSRNPVISFPTFHTFNYCFNQALAC